MFIIFLTIVLSTFALLNLYIIKRFVNKLDFHDKYKKYIKIFLAINFIGILGYMYARYNPIFSHDIFFLLSLPIGILFILFCISIIYDISRVILNTLPIDTNRRNFFKKSMDISSFVIGSSLIGHSIHRASTIEIEKVHIKLSNLNKQYKIVQLSDVHIGGLIKEDFISHMVKQVNILKPDVVVITGDLVDTALQYALPSLKELQKLQSTYGTYFCVGNHEYIHGVEPIIKTIKSLGIKVLENENIFVGDNETGFNLAGVYDVMGYRVGHHQPDIGQALKNKKNNRPTILLAHQPRFINEVYGIDLMLSGHTHGGQIYPFKFLVSLVQPYIAGLYKHDKNTQVYVNKGTGFWGPPMRLGTSCEITDITIS